MQYKLTDLLEVGSLQALMESLHEITGVSVGILDEDGQILIAAGWQDICVYFHRVNPRSVELCRFSDDCVRNMFAPNIPSILYQCPNGLFGAAAPIYVNKTHLGTVFAGQYLREPPDIEFFKEQAAQYQYDEVSYLAAVNQVPVLEQETVDHVLTFFSRMADILTKMAYVQSRQIASKNQELKDSEEKYQAIINNMPGVALQSYDRRGRILYWNKASEQVLGWTAQEATGKMLDQLILDAQSGFEFRKLIRSASLWKRSVGPIEWRVRAKDGSERILMATIFAIRFGHNQEYICMDVDITERKHWERELQRLDRLNLVGQLAASIGHEVRNPMTTVRGYLQFLRNKDETKSIRRQLDIMIEEIDRANSIITEFLALAKNKTINPERRNLNDIINTLAPLLEANALSGNHSLVLNLSDIPDLLLDEKEIRQLILNLACNAFEAMVTGGSVTIETYTENRCVALAVKDIGPGIAPDILERLGTPFVTTKESGTGLGLAVCYSIAARHRAEIKVEPLAPGTAFYIRFKIDRSDNLAADGFR
jgi:PAS domain S-box-containing protein